MESNAGDIALYNNTTPARIARKSEDPETSAPFFPSDRKRPQTIVKHMDQARSPYPLPRLGAYVPADGFTHSYWMRRARRKIVVTTLKTKKT